jgi:cell division protein FtsQ
MNDNRKNNELVKKMRKIKKIKKTIVTIIFMFCVICLLCYKLPCFNVKTVNVSNNDFVSAEEIIGLANISTNDNVFFLKGKNIKNNLIKNAYIKGVKIKRKLPSTIELVVDERKPVFYFQNGNYTLIDSEGNVLERCDSLRKQDLIEIKGVKFSVVENGKEKVENEKVTKILNDFSDLIDRNQSGVAIRGIDVSNIMDMTLQINNLTVKIGSYYDMQYKLNRALNIVATDSVKNKSGYVDVSFNGNPVVSLRDE